MESGVVGLAGHGCTSFTQQQSQVESVARGEPQARVFRFGVSTWLWIYCVDHHCNHHRAVALVPWAIRWGVTDPVPLIRRNFKCVMCGSEATTYLVGVDHDTTLTSPFPTDRQVGIGGRRLAFESWNDKEPRCAAIYESKRPIWSKFWPC
jgi:hypothetical protein